MNDSFRKLFLTIALGLCLCATGYAANNKALIIGVSQYHELDCLSYADRDALELYDFFIHFGEYLPDDIVLVLNQNATKTTISNAFSELHNKSQNHAIDHLIIAYSGHGMPRHLLGKKTSIFLAPTDASLSDNRFYISEFDSVENDTFITRGWLARQIATLNARKIILLIDSCYSGISDFGELFAKNLGCRVAIEKGRRFEKGVKEVTHVTPAEKTDKMVAFIAAGSETQPSVEYDLLRHGAMSYCVLKYLEAVRLTTDYGTWHEVPIAGLFSAVYRIFENLDVKSCKLIDIHQPMLFPIPDYQCVSNMTFQKIKGVKRESSFTGMARIDTDTPGALVFVDGKQATPTPKGVIELPVGKHRIALLLPQTNFREVFTENIKTGELSYRSVTLRGELFVESFWEEKVDNAIRLIPGPELTVYLDGQPAGKTNLHLSGLESGTHALEIEYEKISRKRKIEIRPGSPLRVRFVLNREKMSKAAGVGKRLPF
jgi:Caspase domain/PEGA domain